MKIDFESISSLSLSGFTSVLVVLDQEKKQNQLSIICLDNRSYMKHYSYFRNAINYKQNGKAQNRLHGGKYMPLQRVDTIVVFTHFLGTKIDLESILSLSLWGLTSVLGLLNQEKKTSN